MDSEEDGLSFGLRLDGFCEVIVRQFDLELFAQRELGVVTMPALELLIKDAVRDKVTKVLRGKKP